MREQRPPKVFISYSHDTVAHQERVLDLADRLRADGIDAEIDQYNDAPPEGWPLWCERQIERADFVLMVCTETYYRRVRGEEAPGKGHGVVWEAAIIRQLIYDAGVVSSTFVPVLFSDGSADHIPTPIKGWTRYVVDTEDDYQALYRRLTKRPQRVRPKRRKISQPPGAAPVRLLQNAIPTPRSRFLDALDSARFPSRPDDVALHLVKLLYVKAHFFLALIAGDSIVISENQLVDSLGFVEAFSELQLAAKGTSLEADLPVAVALRPQHGSVFAAVSHYIGDENTILSLWQHLTTDTGRRKRWANAIAQEQKPSGSIVLDEESALLDRLWVMLEYLRDRYVHARDISAHFAERINRIVSLSDRDVYAMLTGGSGMRVYLTTIDEADAAKEVRDALREIHARIGDITTRSSVRRELTPYCQYEPLRDGINELVDGIYNQILGMGTGAVLVQTSTLPPRINKYISAGYALATYLQDTYRYHGHYAHWELFYYDGFPNMAKYDDHGLSCRYIALMEAVRQDAPWSKLVAMRSTRKWQNSLKRWRRSLDAARKIDETLLALAPSREERKELEDYRKGLRLEDAWTEHVDTVANGLRSRHWAITPTAIIFSHPAIPVEFSITYSCLKTKVDIDGDDGFKKWREYRSFKGRMDEGGHETGEDRLCAPER